MQTEYAGISGSTARTVEAWIKTTANANPSDGGTQQIITDWGTFVTGGRFTFNVLWSNAIRLEVGGSGLSGTIPVNDGLWHHVAAVYDPLSINPYKLYVDGVLDIEGDIITDINTVLGTDLRIGQRVDAVRNFDGTIDEVRVWDYARTIEELIADMNNEYCEIPDGLVAYYKFNHGVAGGSNPGVTILDDFSGADNEGTLFNFTLDGAVSNWVTGADLGSEIEVATLASACESYTVPSGDETYVASGIYMDTLTSVFGCDSILTIDLTIGAIMTTISAEACGSYTVPSGDETHTLSGVYMDTLTASEGCDSILTIDLTINFDTEATLVAESCTMYESPSGEVYTESGTYVAIIPNVSGCDSIITIELEILEATTATIEAATCYSYTSPSGATYSESGSYTDVIMNDAGCYSIITINLTILEDSEALLTVTECEFYTVPSGDATYFETGTYTDVIANVAGCDSLITIDLTIAEVNVAVTSADPTLTATAADAIYQWVDCDNDFEVIVGANEQTFTPTENGNYAVIVTEAGCTDTSECYTIATVGLLQHSILGNLTFYPNPTAGTVNLSFQGELDFIEVVVLDLDGKCISTFNFTNQNQVVFDLEGSNGVYVVQVLTANEQLVFRVVKL